MLTLNDGRSELWQWDTGRKLTVDADCTQVHFSNKFFGRSVDVDVFDGTAEIPDVLLQVDKDLLVWAFVGTAENGYTKISKVFKVNKRNKPADYVFTPTEQTTLGELIERLDKIEESQDPDAIKDAVDDYLANNPIVIDETDPTVPEWAKQPTKPKYTADEVGALPADTVIPTIPDNVSAFRNDAGYLTEHQDLTGYATERYVQGYAQPKGDYLTEVPEGYATEEFVKNKIAEAELGGEEVDLSGYAQKSELPTKVSQLQNDSGYLTAVPDGYAKTEDIPKNPADIGAQPAGNYALKTDIPSVPVRSVNGKTGAVSLSASDVGARPDNWMPTAQEVGALPDTYVPPNQTAAQVGADPAGTATAAVSTHNTSTDSHGDLRLELKAISDRLTAFFDSDNQTLDELSEIVAYITSNKALIDSITTSKVSVADIINNLTTNVANKPLSAAQGVALKGLIDAVSNSLSNYQPKGDYALASAIPTKVSQLQNDKGYLTEHQDISGKLDADKLPEAVNNALAQAKESGEFDGEKGDPGVTPHIGSNGNWYIGSADTGVKAQGKDGTSVTVKSVSESTADGGSNVVTFSDGKTLTVKNGKQGSAGKTPIRGVDYYTEADKAEFSEYIASELAKRGQLKPEFANSIEECTDTTKLYVLPDGFIYAYMLTEVEVGGYTNMVDPTNDDFRSGYRYNASGAITTTSTANAFVSNMFPCKAGDVLRIKGIKKDSSTSSTAPTFVAARLLEDGSNFLNAHTMFLGDPYADPTSQQQAWNAYTTLDDGTIEWVFAVNNSGVNMATDDAYTGASAVVNTRIAGVASDGIENVIVTVNEEIREPEVVTEYAWANTGHAFVPADYEDRIIELETENERLAGEITGLQEQIESGAASAKSGAKWFALGDSITEGWASAVDDTAESGYKQYLNTNEAERWVSIVADKNGYQLTNYGVGGTGYAYAKTGTVNARAQVADIDFSQCDFVTLAYGVNDWKGKATLGSMDDDIDTVDAFVSNMRYVIKKILTDNPYCKIFVITPLNCRSLGTYDTNFGINYAKSENASGPGLEDIFRLEKSVCEYHGIELIDMTHCSIINRENIKTMLPDYVHPTVKCHAVMARELAKKIAFQ